MSRDAAGKKNVIVIGAGPAGLTAALELMRNSNSHAIVFEALEGTGGISRTVNYKGNRMDIGGHRFFSKNDWVMAWWGKLMPIAPVFLNDGTTEIPEADRFLLVRNRLSRIYFLRKFFDYPISLSLSTIKNLGVFRLSKIAISYIRASIFQRKPERNLEDFLYNRFGSELYRTFFKDYTEKVWGVRCKEISPSWGAQRIKGLSIWKAIAHAIKGMVSRSGTGVKQENIETSLIERFLYPKLGPGQMWDIAAEELQSLGGEIHFQHRVIRLRLDGSRIAGVETETGDGRRQWWEADQVISSMPVRELIDAITPEPPAVVREVAKGLVYRDFITMGLLVKRLKAHASVESALNLLPDTWIYVQEPDVRIGRLQIFNNWSPALLKDPESIWLGLEYFCQEGDDLWCLGDEDFSRMAVDELSRIGILDSRDVLDYHVVRVPKAYPAYFGSYDRFGEITNWTDSIHNLFLIGRNGMHRYNNQDHSMLSAKHAVDLILSGSVDKSQIWNVNADEQYHEEK